MDNYILTNALMNRHKLKKSELLTVISELESRLRYKNVSIDMSTSDKDYGNRIFAKIIERQGDTLLCCFTSANYDFEGKKLKSSLEENIIKLKSIIKYLDCYVDELRIKKDMLIIENNNLRGLLKDGVYIINEYKHYFDVKHHNMAENIINKASEVLK